MGQVRVLRLMEYVYASQEAADDDMSHWSVAAIGSRTIRTGCTLKSTILLDLQPEGAPPWPPQPRPGHILNDCLRNGCAIHAHLFDRKLGFQAPEALEEAANATTST